MLAIFFIYIILRDTIRRVKMKRTTKQLSAAMAIAALTTTTFVTHADTITVTTETNQKQVVAGIGAGAWGLGGTFAKSNYGGIAIGGNAKSQIG